MSMDCGGMRCGRITTDIADGSPKELDWHLLPLSGQLSRCCAPEPAAAIAQIKVAPGVREIKALEGEGAAGLRRWRDDVAITESRRHCPIPAAKRAWHSTSNPGGRGAGGACREEGFSVPTHPDASIPPLMQGRTAGAGEHDGKRPLRAAAAAASGRAHTLPPVRVRCWCRRGTAAQVGEAFRQLGAPLHSPLKVAGAVGGAREPADDEPAGGGDGW